MPSRLPSALRAELRRKALELGEPPARVGTRDEVDTDRPRAPELAQVVFLYDCPRSIEVRPASRRIEPTWSSWPPPRHARKGERVDHSILILLHDVTGDVLRLDVVDEETAYSMSSPAMVAKTRRRTVIQHAATPAARRRSPRRESIYDAKLCSHACDQNRPRSSQPQP